MTTALACWGSATAIVRHHGGRSNQSHGGSSNQSHGGRSNQLHGGRSNQSHGGRSNQLHEAFSRKEHERLHCDRTVFTVRKRRSRLERRRVADSGFGGWAENPRRRRWGGDLDECRRKFVGKSVLLLGRVHHPLGSFFDPHGLVSTTAGGESNSPAGKSTIARSQAQSVPPPPPPPPPPLPPPPRPLSPSSPDSVGRETTRILGQVRGELTGGGGGGGGGRTSFAAERRSRRKKGGFMSALELIAKIPMAVLDPSLADSEKEDSLRYKRTFFTHEEWSRHRSSRRYSRHISSIASSRVILALAPPVATVTMVAVAVALINDLVTEHLLPPFFPLLHVSTLPFELTAPALALLLVFRTDASYGRFEEARNNWQRILCKIKDMARQGTTWIRYAEHDQKRRLFVRHLRALPYVLKEHFVEEGDLEKDLTGVLSDEELQLVLSASHRPQYVMQVLGRVISVAGLDEAQRTVLETNLSGISQSLELCECLFRIPIPLSYTRLTSRFLVGWHAFLPLALWDQCHWMVIPATLLSAATLFCIEEVGVVIEEPFPMLALDQMCACTQEQILQVTAMEDVVSVLVEPQGPGSPALSGSGAGLGTGMGPGTSLVDASGLPIVRTLSKDPDTLSTTMLSNGAATTAGAGTSNGICSRGLMGKLERLGAASAVDASSQNGRNRPF